MFAMLEKGLLPDCSIAALAALARIQASATMDDKQVRDLRNLPGGFDDSGGNPEVELRGGAV